MSHPDVFAAGDVIAYREARPKSGVLGMRAVALLAENLRAACAGVSLLHWAQQRRALHLRSSFHRRPARTGRVGRRWVGGRWVWRWKDRINRRFVQRLAV